MVIDTGLGSVPWRGLVAFLDVKPTDIAPRRRAFGAAHVRTGIILATCKATARALHPATIFDGLLDHLLGTAKLLAHCMRGLLDIILLDGPREGGIAYETSAEATTSTPPETISRSLLNLKVLARWALDDALARLERSLGRKGSDVSLLLRVQLTIELIKGKVATADRASGGIPCLKISEYTLHVDSGTFAAHEVRGRAAQSNTAITSDGKLAHADRAFLLALVHTLALGSTGAAFLMTPSLTSDTGPADGLCGGGKLESATATELQARL